MPTHAELSDAQRINCLLRVKEIIARESHVLVRGANAAWNDTAARPPMPPSLYELRHLLTDEAL